MSNKTKTKKTDKTAHRGQDGQQSRFVTVDRRSEFLYYVGDTIQIPALVLGVKVYDPSKMHKASHIDFKPSDREWFKIAHQTAGHGCHQHYICGTVLTPKSVDVLRGMERIDHKYYDSQIGCLGTTLDSLVEYRDDLRTIFGVDCNRSYIDLEEAIYPIDCDKSALDLLASDVLPDDLDELINWHENEMSKKIVAWNRFVGCENRWKLYIFGRNSD